SLKGVVYLKNANYSRYQGKPYVDCKIVTSDGPMALLQTHDIFAAGYPAVELLAYIRANHDKPITARIEGELISRKGISIVKANEFDYYVSVSTAQKASSILDSLKNGDTWLTANFKASFDDTVLSHAAQLTNNHNTTIKHD
ncbi:MAG: hypothetical protein RBT34_08790, partial [Anaerolineaceae bacterium]|nr:hypothetical protein [Anaerolineaceae bacterium]